MTLRMMHLGTMGGEMNFNKVDDRTSRAYKAISDSFSHLDLFRFKGTPLDGIRFSVKPHGYDDQYFEAMQWRDWNAIDILDESVFEMPGMFTKVTGGKWRFTPDHASLDEAAGDTPLDALTSSLKRCEESFTKIMEMIA